jgi:hypothetical protein
LVVSIFLGAVGFEYGAVKQGADREPSALDAVDPGQRRTRVSELPCETVANASRDHGARGPPAHGGYCQELEYRDAPA